MMIYNYSYNKINAILGLKSLYYDYKFFNMPNQSSFRVKNVMIVCKNEEAIQIFKKIYNIDNNNQDWIIKMKHINRNGDIEKLNKNWLHEIYTSINRV